MTDQCSPEAIRVLGVLMEKELATPDYYPMTINALKNGCNQKSSRDPVVTYGDTEVESAITELKRGHLVGRASGAGSRAAKYRHAMAEHLRVNREERAILAVLLLRGPQTAGELRSRTERMTHFDDLDAVASILSGLAGRDEPMVVELPVQPGRKEARWAHTLAAPSQEQSSPQDHSGESRQAGSDSVAADAGPPLSLRDEVAELRDRVGRLESELARFKKQFE